MNTIQTLLDEKKAESITVIDVRERSSVTDFYVIATGLSVPHLKAMFNDLQVDLKAAGAHCHRRSGEAEGGWVVLDYVDVIIHLFLPEQRQYYALESLWAIPPAA